MKRLLLVLFVFLTCFALFAETLSGDMVDAYFNQCNLPFLYSNYWRMNYYRDDFGEETEDAYVFYLGSGTYTTDSSTSASDFYYIITDDKDGISFYLLSSFLGSNLADGSLKGTFEIAYKVGSKTIRTNGVLETKKVVFASAEDSQAFRDILKNPSSVKIVITQDGTVFESKKFNLGTINTSSYYENWKNAFTYTVSYDANGGSGKVKGQVVLKGETSLITDGYSLSRSKYEFTGWNTKADGKGLPYEVGQTVTSTEDITLYAQWKKVLFTVNYDFNGGSGSPIGIQTKKQGESVCISNADGLKRSGWKFVGWNTRADGKGLSYQPDVAYSYDKDITLFAQWKQTEFKVVYDANGGIGTTITSKKEESTPLTVIDASAFSRQGYEFSGWNSKADGSGISYGVGDSYLEDKDITLFAQWKQVEFEISYDSNGGSGTVPTDTKEKLLDIDLSEGLELKRVGYELIGWNTKADGTGKSYRLGAHFFDDKDTVLYAQWIKDEFTISYSPNNGSGTVVNQTKKRNFNVVIAGGSIFAKPGFKLAGWNTSPSGDGIKYSIGSTYSDDMDIKLYAQWEIDDEVVAKLGSLKKYEIVEFGTYNGKPIKWIVLDKNDGKALLLSKDILEKKKFNDKSKRVTWKNCTLRKWLNESFYNDSFNEREKDLICETELETDYSSFFASEVVDYVFILSSEEYRMLGVEYHLKEQGSSSYWWLRGWNPASPTDYSNYVGYGGSVFSEGGEVYREYGVRPALWISIQ